MNKDNYFMNYAVKLAEKAKGLTYPNPSVGAVIVHNNKIIARGFHHKAGMPHAEVEAIKSLEYNVPANSEIYVTLEPCSHYGKTPPCADLIIKHKFKRVVVGTLDPNPLVAGNGIRKLENAGIKVVTNILEKKCREINEDFFYSIINKKPFITLKSAMTLDGNCATRTYDSKWITNEKSRKYGHYLRKINSCVLIGANTLLKDNPSLNIRLYKQQSKKYTNIAILDSDLVFDDKSNIAKNNIPQNIYIFTDISNKKDNSEKLEFLKNSGYNIFQVDSDKEGILNIKKIIKILYKKGFNSILVEGGPTAAYNFLKNNLINKIVFFYSGKILGSGISAVNGFLTDKIANAINVKNISIKKIDNDFMVTGYIN